VRCGMRRWSGSTSRSRISGRRGSCGERRACFRGYSTAASRGRGYGLAVKIDAACDNRGIVPTVVKPFRTFVFALTLVAPGFVLGCHAQTPAEAGAKLSPDLARRVEVLIRSKSSIPPEYDIQIGPRTKSDVPGFDAISVTFTNKEKSSKPLTFLLSTDGKTLAEFDKYDISKDPKLPVSGEGRPA